MPQKLTLTEYLRRRGAIKALTKIEADAFGIPWPLQSGWPYRFAGMEITAEMLGDLKGRMATAKQSTASKARRGLEGMGDKEPPSEQDCQRVRSPAAPAPIHQVESTVARLFPGFVLRQARRYRPRSSAPRT